MNLLLFLLWSAGLLFSGVALGLWVWLLVDFRFTGKPFKDYFLAFILTFSIVAAFVFFITKFWEATPK